MWQLSFFHVLTLLKLSFEIGIWHYGIFYLFYSNSLSIYVVYAQDCVGLISTCFLYTKARQKQHFHRGRSSLFFNFPLHSFSFKIKLTLGVGEMAQKSTALVALAENIGLFPSTHMVIPDICNATFMGDVTIFCSPQAPSMHTVHNTYMRQNTYT